MRQALYFSKWAGVVFLSLMFVSEVALSLEWRMVQDSPLLHYLAFVIDRHGYVPYRDIFETSMPGTILLHLAVVKLVGYSDLAFRLTDISFLLVAVMIAWKFLRQFGLLTASAGSLLFAIIYLGYGPGTSFQRDFIGFIPVLGAIYFSTLAYRRAWTGALLVGGLLGLAASIKPHLAIAAPVLFIYYISECQLKKREPAGTLIKTIFQLGLVCALAFSTVLAIPLLWLWDTGGFPAFWEMLTEYLPLHVDMTGNIETVSPEEKAEYVRRMLSRDLRMWLPTSVIGLCIGYFATQLEAKQKRKILMLGGLLICYTIYPVLSNQFWIYHWLPFRVIASFCAALLLLPLANFRGSLLIETALTCFFAVSVLVWAMFLSLQPPRLHWPWGFADQMAGLAVPAPKKGRVDEIAEFLIAADLGPDDRVHPLDWTEGALHGMLIAEAVTASPFIYNYHFYHYVSDPFIQEIRQRHLDALAATRPRFLIETDDELRPKGIDTTDSFPLLEKFVAENYRVVLEGDNYRILELEITAGSSNDSINDGNQGKH